MSHKIHTLVAACCLCLFLGMNAKATDYTYNGTIDLTSGSYSDGFTQIPIVSAPAFNLQVGDTISGTISFANDQALTITDPTGTDDSYLFFSFFPVDATDTYIFYSNSTMTLLDVSGQLALSNPYHSGNTQGALAIEDNEGGITHSNVTFSGFQYSISVSQITDINLQANTEGDATAPVPVTPNQLLISAQQSDLSIITAPEPSTWALLLTGTVGLFVVLRRHARI